jgi:hypothetical protein
MAFGSRLMLLWFCAACAAGARAAEDVASNATVCEQVRAVWCKCRRCALLQAEHMRRGGAAKDFECDKGMRETCPPTEGLRRRWRVESVCFYVFEAAVFFAGCVLLWRDQVFAAHCVGAANLLLMLPKSFYCFWVHLQHVHAEGFVFHPAFVAAYTVLLATVPAYTYRCRDDDDDDDDERDNERLVLAVNCFNDTLLALTWLLFAIHKFALVDGALALQHAIEATSADVRALQAAAQQALLN